MDYTQSPQFVNHAGTGQNMHEENQATTTVWSDKDSNSVIWSLMELVKAGGQAGVQFDEAVPATYKVLLKAMKAAFGGNVTTLNFANSPLVLTKDNAGLVLVDGTAGNVSATLPAANVLALPVRLRFVRIDATANTATISCAGADTLVGGAVSFTLAGLGDQRVLESNGAALWLINAQQPVPYKDLASCTVVPTGGNTLTFTLGAEVLDFRSVTQDSGVPVTRTAAAPGVLVVPLGATLGLVANVAARVVSGWIDNGGTLEPAVCNLAGGVNLDGSTLVSTTAMSAAADAANVVYSATARANVAFRARVYCDIAEAVPGTWATGPTLVQPAGGDAMAFLSGLGYGQIWKDKTGGRSLATTYYAPKDRGIDLSLGGTATSGGTNFQATITSPGASACLVRGSGGSNVTTGYHGLYCSVPPGAAYTVTTLVGTTTLDFWHERTSA